MFISLCQYKIFRGVDTGLEFLSESTEILTKIVKINFPTFGIIDEISE
jgi:hypothetical protein